MTERRFPAPWKIEEQPACFVVRDHYEQALAYIYYEEEPGRRAAEKLLTKDEARRIARITMRAGLFWLTAIGLALSACSIQRGQIANDAQAKMIGLSKEQVLACMGPPLNKDTGGAAEVWSYNSGKGGNCNVKVTIKDDHVSAVDYSGLTGGLLSPNEQCAYAVEKCATKQ